MVELSDEQFASATERGRTIADAEPHARSAVYDRASGRLIIELTSGAIYSLPARLLQGFDGASDDDIAAVDIDSGYDLHWDALDADFTVGGLLAGRFGNERHMAILRERLRRAA